MINAKNVHKDQTPAALCTKIIKSMHLTDSAIFFTDAIFQTEKFYFSRLKSFILRIKDPFHQRILRRNVENFRS